MAKKKARKRGKKNLWEKPRSLEAKYAADMRRIAKEIGGIIHRANVKTLHDATRLQEQLKQYSKLISPWAQRKAYEIADMANRQDRTAWEAATKEMSAGIRHEIRHTPVGQTFRQFMAEQVTLITSLPDEMGQRVHDLVINGLSDSTRAAEYAEEIARSSTVTMSRAMLIARTESARAHTVFTEARALSIGAESYIWRTARDSDVRESHRKLEGTPHLWSDPPIATDEGQKTERAHPGCIYNCRCYAEPVIPDR